MLMKLQFLALWDGELKGWFNLAFRTKLCIRVDAFWEFEGYIDIVQAECDMIGE